MIKNSKIKLIMFYTILFMKFGIAYAQEEKDCSNFYNDFYECKESICSGTAILSDNITVKKSLNIIADNKDSAQCVYKEEFYNAEQEKFDKLECQYNLSDIQNTNFNELSDNDKILKIQNLCSVTIDNKPEIIPTEISNAIDRSSINTLTDDQSLPITDNNVDNQDVVDRVEISNDDKEMQVLPATLDNVDTIPDPDSNLTSANNDLSWHGSLMFDTASVRLLKQALSGDESFVNSLIPTDLPDVSLDGLSSEEEQKPITPDQVPSFYLNSIMYDDDKNWSIWINGNKMTTDQQVGDISIKYIEENRGMFEYSVSDFDRMSPAWSSKLTKTNGKNYKNEQGNIIAEIISMKKGDRIIYSGKISFLIETNQKFDLYNMEIIEGK